MFLEKSMVLLDFGKTYIFLCFCLGSVFVAPYALSPAVVSRAAI